MHRYSVFANSCVNMPVDPVSKMPKTANERSGKVILEHSSIDSSPTCSVIDNGIDVEKLKDFYRSIPDYNDINHLSETEFSFTLKKLRDKKSLMLGIAIEHNINEEIFDSHTIGMPEVDFKTSHRSNFIEDTFKTRVKPIKKTETPVISVKKPQKLLEKCTTKNITVEQESNSPLNIKSISKLERPKRNHSACSITWQDCKRDNQNEIDKKFDKFFEDDDLYRDMYKTRSMPTSPLRMRKTGPRDYKSITIPKPFKMTARDEENRVVNELRGLRKSFSEDMLNQKCSRKQFKANPVPIESRIPLYNKILEDQAMRRAISKINSEAEMRAQMKPFSFTKREENGGRLCERATGALPQTKKKKRFRARPIPKNLFSNYFYDKRREDNFFRSMNRRIRAEELLRNSSYPGSMIARDQSRISTPAAHSDLPTDPSPIALSQSSINKYRSSSPTKSKKGVRNLKEDLITTSPQPFHFNTEERANKKISEISRKITEDLKSCSNSKDTESVEYKTCAYSALDLKGIAKGRSNLAALLRAEAARRKLEVEAAMRIAEQRRRMESRQRDRLLRSKPAWHLVKNNYEEDIAIRLQTRRDEERMRREEYFHEMELMYGRVQRQPMMFERYYAPRPDGSPIDSILLSPRKTLNKKKVSHKKKSYKFSSPVRSPELPRSLKDQLSKFDDGY